MTETQTKIWVSGHNMSGYMPESSPYITSSWESARDSIAEEIEQWASTLHDGLTTSKFFDCGREEWSAAHLLWQFEQHDGVISYEYEIDEYSGPIHDEIVLTDHDEDILKEIAELDELLVELKELPKDSEWWGSAKYTSYWINESERSTNEIPEELEGDELEQFLDDLNEQGY